jgi:type I restriction enzyme, R subunit
MGHTNFSFLKEKWEILYNLGKMAEQSLYVDPHNTLVKLRLLSETIVEYILAYENIELTGRPNQKDKIVYILREEIIDEEVFNLLDTIRKQGNKAAHEAGYGTLEVAKPVLQMAYRLSVWFMQYYGDWQFTPNDFELPSETILTSRKELEKTTQEYEDEISLLKYKLKTLEEEKQFSLENKQKAKEKIKSSFRLSEEETRIIIDEKLRLAGWEADSNNLKYSKGTRPHKGKNIAISEYPLEKGRADYALFIGNDLYGLIEAKKMGKSVLSDIGQSARYAVNIPNREGENTLGRWGDYRVPFLFSTNGRPYYKNLEIQSGIWFLDVRNQTNHPKALESWYSPEGLKRLYEKDVESAEKKLRDEKLDYLNLRPYQEQAILSVEEALENKQREILLAMATGTGKTRMAIGLIYRLIKSKRFNRILFLVDRGALGEQAEAAFKDSKLEKFQSFTEIYELQALKDVKPNIDTKVHIATVQGMLKRIFYNNSDENIPTVDQYDCIIVDEAHRGYTLDKEMSELEIQFRDHNDYVSKYRKVIDYFDSVKIGLTATPALHTKEIFGDPVFLYSYREAVIDDFLVDHEPPFQFETELKKLGISWSKGDDVTVYDTKTGSVDNQVIEDEVNIEIAQFNQKVITESFNQVVLEKLATYIDPTLDGKTLIFAANDDHADMVVKIFKEELEKIHGPINDKAIMKITGSIKEPLHAIKLFKNETYPNVAVTVDLLSTGVDVPKITNIVFLRRVRSRILYEQMLGRATRKCDEIGKDRFFIYDAVGLYESLKSYSDMKPVVTKPKVTITQMTEELKQIEDASSRLDYKNQIVVKMLRKKSHWTQKEKDDFAILTGGQKVEEFINWVKKVDESELASKLESKKDVVKYFDENRERPNFQYVSQHSDKLIEVTRGYGQGEKPEDYLESFSQFIKENMNLIPALTIVCTRPSELTREELRKLRLELDRKGYSENSLQSAWREAKSEDIAADIISFIRKQALGDPLISHEERIRNAMGKIYSMKPWTNVQKQWLERIEKQLLKESVLDPNPVNAFNVEPFKSKGGYKKLNIVFNGELDNLVQKINHSLYDYQKRQQA